MTTALPAKLRDDNFNVDYNCAVARIGPLDIVKTHIVNKSNPDIWKHQMYK